MSGTGRSVMKDHFSMVPRAVCGGEVGDFCRSDGCISKISVSAIDSGSSKGSSRCSRKSSLTLYGKSRCCGGSKG